jgi:hypothetical protein
MHRVPNYGSFMQAFSLKRMLETFGHEVVFVDFEVQPDIEHRDDWKSKIICKKLYITKYIKGSNLGNKLYETIKSHTKSSEIVKKQMIFSSCNGLLGVTKKYRYRTKVDVLLIGSDEVFNCTQAGYNIGYSLELFGKKCRAGCIITYAASFGNTTYSKLAHYGVLSELQELLNKMQAISVRDKNSKQIIERICNEEPEYHLDPVLVGNIENIFTQEPLLDNYIVLYGYTYRFTIDECEKIVDFAHARNKIVVAIGEPQYRADKYICCRPDEVIGYFKKADYVITDTFHGTIFSVITHRKFLTVVRNSIENAGGGNSEKLECLLDDLDLRNRQLVNFARLNAIDDDINYERVDDIRRQARKKTLQYLNENTSMMKVENK